MEIERIKVFQSIVKNTRFEQLSASSDIGRAIIMGYTQALEDNKGKKYTEEDMIEFAFNTYHYISELMGVPFRQISENKLHAMYNFEQFKKK